VPATCLPSNIYLTAPRLFLFPIGRIYFGLAGITRQSKKKAQAGMVSPIRPVPCVENVPDYLLEIERRQSKEELLQIVYCFSFFEA
jgi:hypothetical protein